MPLTTKQAKLLFHIVREAKKEGAWLVPTDQRLAALMGNTTTVKAVGDMKRRIINNYSWAFREDNGDRHPQRPWYVNPDVLVSEGSSALYLLKFHQLCSASEDTTISKTVFHGSCIQTPPFKQDPDSLDRVFIMAKKAEYLEEMAVPGRPLRYTKRTSELLEYLNLLASAV